MFATPKISTHRVLAAGWLATVAVGMTAFSIYDNTPGAAATPATRLPAGVTGGPPLLILFAHPKCPCTADALDELAEVLARHEGDLRVRVLFVRPPGTPDGWEFGRNWDRAAAIRNVRPEVDIGGRAARAFGARTSGQVFLYAGDGALMYCGGLSRRGMPDGRATLVQVLRDGTAAAVHTDVFGCPLFDPEEAAEGGR